METIYIDRLFVINLIIDYLILLVTAKICGLYLRRARYYLASLFGALYAALSVLPPLFFLTLLPVKLSAGIITAVIAFSKDEKLFRCTVSFFGVSALFGGAVWAVSLQSGTSLTGYIFLPVSLPVLALSFGMSYALLSVIFRRRVKNAGRKILPVVIQHGGKSVSLLALCDSGNTLYDAVTGSSVLIVHAERLRPVFGDKTDKLYLPATELIADCDNSGLFRLVPYRAVGVSSSLLAAFRPEHITVNGKLRDDIIVAVSPTEVAGDGFNCVI